MSAKQDPIEWNNFLSDDSMHPKNDNLSVILSCEDDHQRLWCFTRVSNVEKEEIREEWVLASKLEEMLKIERENDADEEDDDPAIPPSVQDHIKAFYESRLAELLSEKEQAEKELQVREMAFEKYRDRARESLTKTSRDLSDYHDKTIALTEQLQLEKAKQLALHKQLGTATEELETARLEAQLVFSAEKRRANQLQERVTDLQDQLLQIAANSSHQREERSEEIIALEEKTNSLQAQLQHTIAKEATLLHEMKRKSDNARVMIEGKDKEIAELKKQLTAINTSHNNNNTSHHLTASPSVTDHNMELEKIAFSSSPRAPSITPPKITIASAASSSFTPHSAKTNQQHQTTPHNTSLLLSSSGDYQQFDQVDDILGIEEKRVMAEFLRLYEQQQQNKPQPSKSPSNDSHHGTATPTMTMMTPTSNTPHTPQNSFVMFNEEFFRRAIHRENDLLEKLKVLKSEINHLRGRLSIMHHTSITIPHNTATVPSSSSSSHHLSHSPASSGAVRRNEASYNSLVEVPLHHPHHQEEQERGQRLAYLKQAFTSFLTAKTPAEMQNLGRVICAILGVTIEEQAVILDHIMKLSPAVVATSTFDSLSQSFASIFS